MIVMMFTSCQMREFWRSPRVQSCGTMVTLVKRYDEVEPRSSTRRTTPRKRRVRPSRRISMPASCSKKSSGFSLMLRVASRMFAS